MQFHGGRHPGFLTARIEAVDARRAAARASARRAEEVPDGTGAPRRPGAAVAELVGVAVVMAAFLLAAILVS